MKEYNKIVLFNLGEELIFPDFTLRYIRTKKVPTPYGGAFNYFYFEVYSQEGETLEIQWVSGGRYQNTVFTYNKSDYQLILGAYEDVNANRKSIIALKKDQLIVVKEQSLKKN